MPTDDQPDHEREGCYLRHNGKAFRCDGYSGKCKERLFWPSFNGPTPVYTCLTCRRMFEGSPSLLAIDPPRNDWQTPGGSEMAPQPGGFWDTLHAEYHYNVDLAASAKNSKCDLFFDFEHDALKQPSWQVYHLENTRGWGQPPYKPTGTITLWLQKAVEQAAQGIFSTWLIPMSSSVGWFNDLVVPYAEWHTFKGRVSFIDPTVDPDSDEARTSPKQDNLFVIYDPNSNVIGHTAVRSAKDASYIWRKT